MAELAYFEQNSGGLRAAGAPVVVEDNAIATRRLARFSEILERVLADRDTAERLTVAGITVRIDLNDLPGRNVVLDLRGPVARVRVGSKGCAPDVRLAMWTADLEAVLLQRSYLPLHVLSGEVVFEGYVRKLLRVMPILSAAAVRAHAALGTGTATN